MYISLIGYPSFWQSFSLKTKAQSIENITQPQNSNRKVLGVLLKSNIFEVCKYMLIHLD